MERIPKYKAWDKKENIMCDVGYIDFVNQRAQIAVAIGDSAKCYASWHRSFDEIELLGFIGFNDKNDNELYHRDIVKIFGYCVFEVVEHNGAFGYKVDRRFPFVPFANHLHLLIVDGKCDDIEKIGNVHENGDLLENT